MRNAVIRRLFPGFEDVLMAREDLLRSCCHRAFAATINELEAEPFRGFQMLGLTNGLLHGEKPAPELMRRGGWRAFDEQFNHLSAVEARTTSLTPSDVMAIICRMPDDKARVVALRR
eukprot:1493572-Amphidinium_carterae.1